MRPGLRKGGLLAWLALYAVGCGAPAERTREAAPTAALPSATHASTAASTQASATPSAAAPASAALPPAPAATAQDLAVEGFLPQLVWEPEGATGPSPVLVIAHGAGGTPEAHCDRYREFVKLPVFFLCTRGAANNKHLPPEQRGYFYNGHHDLGKETLGALVALKKRYGDRVDTERVYYLGYSQGASMGVLFLQGEDNSKHFRRALLVEGGSADWNVALSKKLNDNGLNRVAIVCAQLSCKQTADRSLTYMKRGGLEGRIWYASGSPHTYRGRIAPMVEEAFAWLIEGDERLVAK